MRKIFPFTRSITVEFDQVGTGTINSNYFVYSRSSQTLEVWGKSSGFSYINHKVYGQVNDPCIRDTIASIDKNPSAPINQEAEALLNHGAVLVKTRR